MWAEIFSLILTIFCRLSVAKSERAVYTGFGTISFKDSIVDTNSDPRKVEYVIPGNDDASKSIDMILSIVSSSIKDGLSQRKAEKEKSKEEGEKVSADADADFNSDAAAAE